MGLLFDSVATDIFAIFLSIIVCCVAYFKWIFTYWEKRKVPYLKPSIPWGTMNNVFTNPQSLGDLLLKQYKEAKQNGNTITGLFVFARPVCIITDPILIKQIMAPDFKYFMNRGEYVNEKDDPLSAHLFALEGAKWKNLRSKLTPTFTTGKMKMMFNIINECADQLKVAMEKITTKKDPVDIKDILARFTTNVIGSAAFGLECNTFTNEDSEFRKYGKKIFSQTPLVALKELLCFINPDVARFLRISNTPSDVSHFFRQVVKDTVEYREKNKIERNDFMQLLIQMKNGGNRNDNEGIDDKTLTLNELSAQSFVFFVAGFETSSTTMTFCLFELANNPDIQDKVRKEIQEVLALHGGKLTYEAINDMKYMGNAIDETLRKYPPLPILTRYCNEEYKVPDSEIVIEKGTQIFIPIIGLHNDPEYFSNPEKFDPERFSEENKQNMIPYTYLPFGEGPRICIGLRFGVMQTKVGLAVLLQNFRFSVNTKTKVPLEMDPGSFIPTTAGGMWLDVEKV